MKADLHVHTTASDGVLSPSTIVRIASEREISVIAITDHDSVEGVTPALNAAKDFPSLIVIPGVEISTDIPHCEVHILGYFIDCSNEELIQRLETLRNSRQVRAKRMVSRLADLGMPLNWERVQELAGSGSIGRPHIARAMVEQRYTYSIREAFNKYIGRNGSAYVGREKMAPEEAVRLVMMAKGLPVIAHPMDIYDLEGIIPDLVKEGLVGMEVYYGNYSRDVVMNLASIANKYGLIACGGSDYHGVENIDNVSLGDIDIPQESIEKLFSLANQYSLQSNLLRR